MRPTRLLLSAVLGSWIPVVAASAAPITIVSTPQETTGPFRYNAFHSADASGGASGAVLAWLDLDASFGTGNFYDPATGQLQARFELFQTSALSTKIGEALLTSSDVDATALGDAVQNDVIVGDLLWQIDLSLSGTGALYTAFETDFGAEGDDTWDLTIRFADVMYATSTNGVVPNTWDGTTLAIWGGGAASGLTYSGSSLLGGSGGMGGFGSTADLGVDLVLSVPEPALAWLAALSLAAARARRRGGPASG